MAVCQIATTVKKTEQNQLGFKEHKMKVLVTGATGFLGKNLVPVLSENHEVIGVGSQFWDLRDQDNAQDC